MKISKSLLKFGYRRDDDSKFLSLKNENEQKVPSTEDILKESTYNGLSSKEVDERIADGRVNGNHQVKTKSVAQIFATNIFTFFNLVLILLLIFLIPLTIQNSAVTRALQKEFPNNPLYKNVNAFANFGFVLLLIINTAVGIAQELKAKKTIDKLSILSAPKVKVVRDGAQKDIQVSEIVVDDLILLKTGHQVCADSVVISGQIEVNESLITGEPDAILKMPGDKIISGSYVVSGRAATKVEKVGLDSFAMKISAGAKYLKKHNSEILKSIMLIIKIMAIIIIPVGIALFCTKFFASNGGFKLNGNQRIFELTKIGKTTIGTLLGMIPSGLIALTTAVFAISVIRLSKHKTLAQNLYCIETLARVDVICLDKTGTITEGSMDVHSVYSHSGDTDQFKKLLKNFIVAVKDDNTTANAIKDYLMNVQSNRDASEVIAFSSQRKWSAAKFDKTFYILGAPEFVFKEPTNQMRNKIMEMSQQGFRVLAFASTEQKVTKEKLPNSIKFEGFIFLTDKIRKEAPDTLKFFKQEGVDVKIISGDNPDTVRAVALRAGLTDCENIIDMSTLSSEEEIYDAAEKYTVFGRVLPDQKLLLVKALKANGHTVAMTGDGVNDVLALKESDCSITVASGSDAAKNVSSLILMDSNFASIPKVVAEGRRSINNLERSASLYLVKTFYSLCIAILFMMLVDFELPFEPKHLTFIAGLTIGIPSFVLALEPNHNRVTGRFLPKVLSDALPGTLAVMLGIAGVIISSKFILPKFISLDSHQIQGMYVITTMLISFVYLFKVSMPFNNTNTVMFFLLFVAFIGAYFINFGSVEKGQTLQSWLGIENANVKSPMVGAILIVVIIAGLVFALLSYGLHRLYKKYNNGSFLDIIKKKIQENKAKQKLISKL